MEIDFLVALLSLLICVVAAQSGDPTCGSATVSSQADAAALASKCPTISGSLTLSTGLTGAVSLDGITVIEGDLLCEDLPITSLSATTLTAVKGKLLLSSLASLTGFTTDGTFAASNIFISGTALTSFTYTNEDSVSSVEITGNKGLNSISLSFANALVVKIDSNGDDLTVYFPQLSSAGNVFISDCTQVLFPNLATISNSLSLTNNEFLSFEIEKLMSIGTNFIFSDNADVTKVLLPSSPISIGGTVQATNNPKLDDSQSASFSALERAVVDIVTTSSPPAAVLTIVPTSSAAIITEGHSTTTTTDLPRQTSPQLQQLSSTSQNSQESQRFQSSRSFQTLANSVSIANSLSTGVSISETKSFLASSTSLSETNTVTTASTTARLTESPSAAASKPPRSQLSTAAKVGLAVGITTISVIVIGIIDFFYFFSKRRRLHQSVHELPAEENLEPPPTQSQVAQSYISPDPISQTQIAVAGVLPRPPARAQQHHRVLKYGKLMVSNIQTRTSRPRHPLELAIPIDEKAMLAARERTEESQKFTAELSAAPVPGRSRIHELYGNERYKN